MTCGIGEAGRKGPEPMEKKILIAVDGSAASAATLAYVAMMEAANITDLAVVLIHVMRGVPPQLRREGQGCPQSYQLGKRLEESELSESRFCWISAASGFWPMAWTRPRWR